jgi:hypothetical protein
VTSCWQWLHQTLESSDFLMLGGIAAQSFAAGCVNLGNVSMDIVYMNFLNYWRLGYLKIVN